LTLRLQARFFLSHAAVAGLALAGGALVFLAGARLALGREMQNAEVQQLQAFALAAREAALDQQPLDASDFMRSASRQPGLAFAAIDDPSGFRLVRPAALFNAAMQGLKAGSSGASTEFSPAQGVPPLRLWVMDYKTPGGTGRVGLAWSLTQRSAELDARLRALIPALLLALAAAVLLGGLAAGIVARPLARPLAELSLGTQAVRQGRLEHLVQVGRTDEIGDLARDFNRMTVELRELDRIKRDFVNGVTHDLGTPLHAMRAAANFLQSGKAGPLTDAQSDYLLILSNATELLRQFLDNLLTVARIEAGKVEPYPESLDPVKEVEDLVRLYEPQAEERGLDLELEPTASPMLLMADRQQFRQMVLNLLTNAFKFTDKGRVSLSLHLEEGWLRMQVSDTGIGIEEKYQELVFDKFFRVRQPEGGPERKGTGLGLAIARGLAVAHGGALELFSRPGMGSTFTLRLPRARRAV
jgi:signal transduction histidine kinase